MLPRLCAPASVCSGHVHVLQASTGRNTRVGFPFRVRAAAASLALAGRRVVLHSRAGARLQNGQRRISVAMLGKGTGAAWQAHVAH